MILSYGNCLNLGEIARLLRHKASYRVLVTNPNFWSELSQRSQIS